MALGYDVLVTLPRRRSCPTAPRYGRSRPGLRSPPPSSTASATPSWSTLRTPRTRPARSPTGWPHPARTCSPCMPPMATATAGSASRRWPSDSPTRRSWAPRGPWRSPSTRRPASWTTGTASSPARSSRTSSCRRRSTTTPSTSKATKSASWRRATATPRTPPSSTSPTSVSPAALSVPDTATRDGSGRRHQKKD